MTRRKQVIFLLIILSVIVTSPINVSAGVMNFDGESGDSAAQSNVDWWPMFHHDLGNTGYSTSTGPITNNTIWNFTTNGIIDSSPAVVDGRVYVGSNDHTFYCLNASAGTLIWNFTTGDLIQSSPAVVDGRVYVGSHDHTFYCLNASAGTLIWNFTTSESLAFSSPAVVDGRVYVGSNDHTFYCLNASAGTLIWNYTVGDWIHSSPAVVDGRVYVGSNDKNVYCLNASNGHKEWSFATGSYVISSPAVVDGKVYVGSFNGKVYCLNALTGAHIWNYTLNGEVWSSPAVADGKVYVGSYGMLNPGKVYCLDASAGTLIWSYTTTKHAPVGSSPAVVDGKVYVGSYDHSFYCLDASAGTLIWSYITSDLVYSSPAVVDGKVYVGSRDKNIYAFGPPAGNYILTITETAGGTTIPEPGVYNYSIPSSISVSAIPDAQYVFDHWELNENNVGSANPYLLIVDNNYTLHAVFLYSGIRDIAVTNVTTSKDGCTPMPTLCQGFTANVSVTVLNEGDHTENVTVTAYANTTVIGTQTFNDLAPSAQITLTFIWNASGFAKGNYTVSANATAVPDETDLSDNSFTDGIVAVTHIGDVNGDGKVDLSDVLAVALAFGSFPGQPLWNPNLDVDGNGKVDLTDYLATALNYGYA